LKGVIINSHTGGEYLDDPKFSPIFAAAEALNVPLYLHPNTPPPQMIQPFLDAGLDGAIYGFGVETGLHALRIITKGVLDRYTRLKLVLGHLGEALPFWMFRLDSMHRGFPLSRSDPQINQRSRDACERVAQVAAEHGWGEYRSPPAFADLIAGLYSYNNHVLGRFAATLKDAVDPNGIIAAGRGGVWPRHLRGSKA
jgi:predicted TIM-barrel fold metal-dependent hydrolase